MLMFIVNGNLIRYLIVLLYELSFYLYNNVTVVSISNNKHHLTTRKRYHDNVYCVSVFFMFIYLMLYSKLDVFKKLYYVATL